MIVMPTSGPEDWRKSLADPDKQWKRGYSAFELAYRWQNSAAFPPEISALLNQQSATQHATLLLGIPEHRVALAGGARASQTDLWVLARTNAGLLSIAVEGKVNESFGPTIGEWQPGGSAGRTERWAALCKLLEVAEHCDAGIRYQLFHRTASALLEAKRFFARGAAVIVHSFSPTSQSFDDFRRFVQLMGGDVVEPGRFVAVPPREGVALYFGWAHAARSSGESP